MRHALYIYGMSWRRSECTLGLYNDMWWPANKQFSAFRSSAWLIEVHLLRKSETLCWSRRNPNYEPSMWDAHADLHLLRKHDYALIEASINQNQSYWAFHAIPAILGSSTLHIFSAQFHHSVSPWPFWFWKRQQWREKGAQKVWRYTTVRFPRYIRQSNAEGSLELYQYLKA